MTKEKTTLIMPEGTPTNSTNSSDSKNSIYRAGRRTSMPDIIVPKGTPTFGHKYLLPWKRWNLSSLLGSSYETRTSKRKSYETRTSGVGSDPPRLLRDKLVPVKTGTSPPYREGGGSSLINVKSLSLKVRLWIG